MSSTWTYGGTALSTLGKVTLINDYLDMPERRGDNMIIPYRHGTVFAAKYFDQRKITFGIAVTAASAAALETLFDTMRGLFAPRTEQTLSNTREDSTVRTIQATVDSTLQVERITNTFARVIVEFTACKPYFRLSTAIADNTVTINASPKAMTVTNPGTVEEREATFLLTGPLLNPSLSNTTSGTVLTYTGTISAGHTVTIAVNSYGEYTATHSVSGNVIGNVTHSGSSALMVFNVGNNTLAITDGTATTGTVKISFYAPFL